MCAFNVAESGFQASFTNEKSALPFMSDSLSSHEELDVACCFVLMMSHAPLQVYTRSVGTYHGVQRPQDLPGASCSRWISFLHSEFHSLGEYGRWQWVSAQDEGRVACCSLMGLMSEPPWGSGMGARTQELLWGHCWLAVLPIPRGQEALPPTTISFLTALSQARIGGDFS